MRYDWYKDSKKHENFQKEQNQKLNPDGARRKKDLSRKAVEACDLKINFYSSYKTAEKVGALNLDS